jgi:hypothetical protein
MALVFFSQVCQTNPTVHSTGGNQILVYFSTMSTCYLDCYKVSHAANALRKMKISALHKNMTGREPFGLLSFDANLVLVLSLGDFYMFDDYYCSDYDAVVYVSCYRDLELISHGEPFPVHDGDFTAADLHLIVVFSEVSVDAHNLNSVLFNPEFFADGLDNFLLYGSKLCTGIVVERELVPK